MYDFDLIVVGGGTGGLTSAVETSNMGKNVAVVEGDKLAGTCLNYGCTPTKSIIHSARLFSAFKKANRFGIEYEDLRLDFKKVMERTRRIVSEGLKRNVKKVADNENLTLFSGYGRFVNENEVQVGGESVSAEKFFIVTGVSPFTPHIEGLENVEYFTYKTILELEELPESIIIVGGGFIGVEYASALNSMGSKVTLLQRGDRLIKNSDSDISKALAEYMQEDGIDIQFGTESSRIEREDGVVITTKEGETIKAQELMMAVGQKPNTDRLNLDACSVNVNRRGFIEVDEFSRTSNKNIWAFGDVVGRKMFTHAALKEAEIVVKNAFSNANIKVDESKLPYAVFTDPEIGSVGLTEEEAREKGLEYKTKKAYYSDTPKGLIMDENRGFVKLIYDDKNILGCHAIGPEASILIQEAVALMHCPDSYLTFKNVTHTHPTLSEIFEDLKL